MIYGYSSQTNEYGQKPTDFVIVIDGKALRGNISWYGDLCTWEQWVEDKCQLQDVSEYMDNEGWDDKDRLAEMIKTVCHLNWEPTVYMYRWDDVSFPESGRNIRGSLLEWCRKNDIID